MVMPSDGATPFGDWVKAGALKVGDQISTINSVGPTKLNALKKAVANDNGEVDLKREITSDELALLGIKAANDNVAGNAPVTILDIVQDTTPKRVYNFEVESLPGQLTHNYMVGQDGLWVHNIRGLSGYTRHGLNQAIGNPNRPGGVRASSILDALRNPKKCCPSRGNTTRYIGKSATVIVNACGEIVTVYGSRRG